jgi:hypothetical protein
MIKIILLLSILFSKNSTAIEENSKNIRDQFDFLFPKQAEIFGVKIIATKNTPDKAISKTLNILKQWLDNDNDGQPDNQLIVNAIVSNKGSMIMGKNERDVDKTFYKIMKWAKKEKINMEDFDEATNSLMMLSANEPHIAYLEETLHLISDFGYAEAYPDIFGLYPGSKIALAMDKARGGFFEEIPRKYPKNAWYSYDDDECEYDCMITEYFYWSLTSVLGAQKNRLEEVQHEWKYNTQKKMLNDNLVMKILNNSEYKIPKFLPK